MSPRGNPAWVAIPPAIRFWPEVDKHGPVPAGRPDLGPCWIWGGRRNGSGSGYGVFWNGERLVPAHRWAYEDAHGPIPEGLEPDHLCRIRLCVKVVADEYGPAHLEAVTHQVNLLRGDTVPARHAAKTHCPQGHPYAGDNLEREANGARRCRTCHRDRMRRVRAQAKAAT